MAKFKIVSEFTVVETLYIEAETEEQAYNLALESSYTLDNAEFGDRHINEVKKTV